MIRNAPTFDPDVLKVGTPVRVLGRDDKPVCGIIETYTATTIKVRYIRWDGQGVVQLVSISDVVSGDVRIDLLVVAGEDHEDIDGEHTYSARQVGAMRGFIEKWRKAARFWEEEAKRLGSTAEHKIRERRRAQAGD